MYGCRYILSLRILTLNLAEFCISSLYPESLIKLKRKRSYKTCNSFLNMKINKMSHWVSWICIRKIYTINIIKLSQWALQAFLENIYKSSILTCWQLPFKTLHSICSQMQLIFLWCCVLWSDSPTTPESMLRFELTLFFVVTVPNGDELWSLL